MYIEWAVTTDREHQVGIDLSMFTGRETIFVDGVKVSSKFSMKLKREWPIHLGEHVDAKIVVTLKYGMVPSADLVVDGRSIEPSMKSFGGKGGQPSTPAWGWFFAVACFAIPVATLGGALPAGLGVVAGIGCLQVSASARNLGLRVALASAIVIAAWGVLIALGVLLPR